jgi:branched-subunit amino acid ABC-type transport system permease component
MRDFFPFIVAGLTAGSLTGMASLGLVLTLRTSGIFNFAHGSVAAVGAYAFWELHTNHGLSWPLALFVCLAVVGPIMGVFLELLARRLALVSVLMQVIATVGLLLAIQGIAFLRYGVVTRMAPTFLPDSTIDVAGARVGYDQLITVAIGLASVTLLYGILKFTRLGVAMRGVVDAPTLFALTGRTPVRVRRWAWMIGCSFAVLSGVLLTPVLGLDATLLTLLVVQAFGAAALGRFEGLVHAYVGGLTIGVVAALSTKYIATVPSLAGFPASLPFIVLFVVLVVAPPGRGRVQSAIAPPVGANPVAAVTIGDGRSPSRRLSVLAALGIAALLALLAPELVGTRLPTFINAGTLAVIFLSLRLLVWTSGQITLAHAAFAAVGAATFAHVTHGLGLPWIAGPLVAGVVAAAVGALLAAPAVRLHGVYLAIATFGFGILLEQLGYRRGLMFGATGLRTAPRPHVLGLDSDHRYYYVVLAAVALSGLLVLVVERTRLGRLLRALADSPAGLEHLGVRVSRLRVVAFSLAAGMAGVAGALSAAATHVASPGSFPALQSLFWVAVLAVTGRNLYRGPLLAAGLIAVAPSYLPDGWTDYQPVVFGVLAVCAALAQSFQGVRGVLTRQLPEAEKRLRRSPVRERSGVLLGRALVDAKGTAS